MTATLEIVDGIDCPENKDSWYHIHIEDQMQRPGRVSASELVPRYIEHNCQNYFRRFD